MRRRGAIQLCSGTPHCYGYLGLRSEHRANICGAPVGTGGRLGRELRLDAVGRPAFALAATGKAEVVGRMPLHQLVQHAGSRVHIDSGRPAPSHRPQYIVGQHLGGGEIAVAPKGAPHRAVSEESALSSGTADPKSTRTSWKAPSST